MLGIRVEITDTGLNFAPVPSVSKKISREECVKKPYVVNIRLSYRSVSDLWSCIRERNLWQCSHSIRMTWHTFLSDRSIQNAEARGPYVGAVYSGSDHTFPVLFISASGFKGTL